MARRRSSPCQWRVAGWAVEQFNQKGTNANLDECTGDEAIGMEKRAGVAWQSVFLLAKQKCYYI